MHIRMMTKTGRLTPSYSSQTPDKLYQELWGFVMGFLTIAAVWPAIKEAVRGNQSTTTE